MLVAKMAWRWKERPPEEQLIKFLWEAMRVSMMLKGSQISQMKGKVLLRCQPGGQTTMYCGLPIQSTKLISTIIVQ